MYRALKGAQLHEVQTRRRRLTQPQCSTKRISKGWTEMPCRGLRRWKNPISLFKIFLNFFNRYADRQEKSDVETAAERVHY